MNGLKHVVHLNIFSMASTYDIGGGLKEPKRLSRGGGGTVTTSDPRTGVYLALDDLRCYIELRN